MTFSQPTLAELISRTEAEVATRLGLGALLDRSYLKVLSRVMAGSTHGLHGHLDFLSLQIIPSTATAANLEQWADLFGLQRKAAEPAQGSTTFTGTDGSSIPAGTLVQRLDGERFSTDASATIASGTALVALTAETAGVSGNTAAATVLSLVSPIAGVNDASSVDASGLSGGVDTESDQDLVDRLRAFMQARPQGGSAADYVAWASEVAGVTRVFVLPANSGLGTVDVTFAVDDDPAGPIPDAAKVTEVQARIDDDTRRDSRPVTAQVTVFAPAPQTLSFTVVVVPDTPEVRQAVIDGLEDMVLREAEPGGTITLNKMNEAISTAPGEEDHTLVSPVADFTVAAGELAVFGTVTFN